MFQKLKFSDEAYLNFMIKLFIGLVPMCLVGPIKWGVLDEIPITFQTLFVLYPALIFGWQIGLTAVICYLLLGGIGVPVFANRASGWHHFLGVTGGFLFAFSIAAGVVGYLAERSKLPLGIGSMMMLTFGHAIILALGFFWMEGVRQTGETVFEFLRRSLAPSMVKVALGTIVMIFLGRFLQRVEK